MESKLKVILISPPYMKLSYPTYHIPMALTKDTKYMNPGLLIASSILDSKNISNRIVKIENPEDLTSIEEDLKSEVILIGISCTCAWEYLESLKIAQKIKQQNENIIVVISGWQIKSIETKVFEDSNDIDYIILGNAENTMIELYEKIINNKSNIIPSVISKDKTENNLEKINPQVDFKILDFSKFPNYKDYIPYTEESRNCPYNCQFCLNSCVADRYQNVPFEVFKQNIDNIEKLYGEDANAILLAANFGVNPTETKKKLEYLKTKKLKWNIELHVDNPWEYYIDDIKLAGINKISIGFESGSPTILRLMNKTSNPENYLKKLVKLLFKLKEQEISVSLNLLFDYRETKETISETLQFLDNNKHLFSKVKANFMFAFDGVLHNIDLTENVNIIVDEYSKKIHAYPVLPKCFDMDTMAQLVDEIESGNYSLEILNSLNDSNTIVKKRYFLK